MKTKSLLVPAAIAAFSLVGSITHAQTPLDDARAALQADDLVKAETLLVPLTSEGSTDAAAFYVLGQVRERQRNLKEAVADYEQATRLDPAKPDYFSTLGIALSQRMGELNFMQQAMTAGKMKKAFEKSVELDPRHVSGLIGLSRYYAGAPEIAGGSSAKAQDFARRVQQLVPYLGEIELGNIANHDEKYAEALTHYETASNLKPDHAGLQFLCGRTLVKLERKDEARGRFEAALKLDPKLDSAAKALAALDAPGAGKS